MKIYLDFDGTVCEHQYPNIGRCNFGFVEVLRRLQDAGHEIVLNTYRVDCNEGTLEKALAYLNEKSWALTRPENRGLGIELLPITQHTPEKIYPPAWEWETIRATNVMFIDDSAPGIPLKRAVMIPGNVVDWDILDKQFQKNGLYLT